MKKRLPLEIRRMFFRSLVSKNYPKVKSFNKLQKMARDSDISYTRKLMLRDFHEVTQTKIRSDTWKFIPKKYLPPEDLIVKQSFGMKRKYHYRYKVTIYNKVTGEYETVVRTIASDRPLTMNQAEQLLRQKVIDPIKEKYKHLYEYQSHELYAVAEKV